MIIQNTGRPCSKASRNRTVTSPRFRMLYNGAPVPHKSSSQFASRSLPSVVHRSRLRIEGMSAKISPVNVPNRPSPRTLGSRPRPTHFSDRPRAHTIGSYPNVPVLTPTRSSSVDTNTQPMCTHKSGLRECLKSFLMLQGYSDGGEACKIDTARHCECIRTT